MKSPAVRIDGREDVPKNDEDELLRAVAHQPVSAAIDARGRDFRQYSEVFVTIVESSEKFSNEEKTY